MTQLSCNISKKNMTQLSWNGGSTSGIVYMSKEEQN